MQAKKVSRFLADTETASGEESDDDDDVEEEEVVEEETLSSEESSNESDSDDGDSGEHWDADFASAEAVKGQPNWEEEAFIDDYLGEGAISADRAEEEAVNEEGLAAERVIEDDDDEGWETLSDDADEDYEEGATTESGGYGTGEQEVTTEEVTDITKSEGYESGSEAYSNIVVA